MHIIKNIFIALFGLAVLFLMIMPNAEEKNDGKTHVKYWYVAGKEDDVPYGVIKFNVSQDSVIIDATPIPWNEHEKKILTAILSEYPPDVVTLVSTVPKWASRRALVMLDDAIKKDNFDTTQFYSALWKEMHYRDRVFALPAYTASFAFFYNKALFEEAGLDPDKPPRTWDEVREYSKLLTKFEGGNLAQIGYIPPYGNLETSFVMSLELDAKYTLNHGTKVNLTSPEIVRSFQEELSLLNDIPVEQINKFKGGFGFGSQHGFIAGKVAMMILGNTFIDQIKTYNPGMNYGVAEIPTFEGKETKSSTGVWWYAIPRGSKHKKAAWDFMKFAVSKDVQLQENLTNGQSLFPTNIQAATDSAFLNYHFAMKIFDKEMRHTESKVICPLVHDVFWREYAFARERVLYRNQTPQEALEQAQRTIQVSLDKAIEYDNYVDKELKFEKL